MALRFATPEDAPRLIAIYAPYILNTCITYEYTVPSVEEFAERIRTISRRMPYLVYEKDGIILGYAYASPHMTRAAYQWDAELSIYMDERHHRSGVGRMLYKTLIALLKELGYYNLYALISIPNDRSIGFHRSLGFKQVGVYPHTGYKLGRWNDLAILEYCTQPQLKHPVPTKSIHDLPKKRIQEILETTQRVPQTVL
ncbi:GNAT family N-acetyltransferase [Faecalispora anaeroviscerum]|uniref:GNAT family N-acetyltransferase n=1 Tax=Faecalispora anaeroviscerum TaxID=2991836 RepID=UPI0024B89BAE|nr:GNAT family N-acetyltransferase [Faecalispora anaeroviscerum]